MSDVAIRGDRSSPWVLVRAGQLSAMGAELRLDRDESRHLVGVLRRRVGDGVVLVDGAGSVAEGRITVVGAEVEVVLEALRTEAPASASKLSVALGVLSSQAMDWAVQKAVELGVGRLVPLLTERTQLGRNAACRRCEHWRRVSLQALKQCHRSWVMEIAQPRSLAEEVGDVDPQRTVYGHADGMWCSAIADEIPATTLLIGPEGGFADAEIGLLRDAGLRGVRFGPHVLRAETAATVGAAWLVARLEGSQTGAR